MQTPILRECWKFLIYIFLHQKRKKCLEFALPKPGEIWKHLANAYNSNSQWREGWNEIQTPILRECWTFFIYIFLLRNRKQCLEFVLPKPGEICKHLAGAYNSNSHAHGLHHLTFVRENKQRNQRNRASRFKETCLRKAQHYQSSLKEEKPLQFVIPLTLLPKIHNLFWEAGLKKGAGGKGKSVTTSS